MSIGIIAGGKGRADKAALARIKAEVWQEVADDWAAATFWQRIVLRLQIHREIRRRINKLSPPWGLYSQNRRD